MDRSLLQHYERELDYIRGAAAEFAREFPGVAAQLSLDSFQREKGMCPDPYVERLLEGFAYLSARVHARLDAGFPRLTQTLLEAIYPHLLAPTPSMTVVRFEPDRQDRDLVKGPVIPRSTVLRTVANRAGFMSSTFRSAHDVTMLPLRVEEARYHRRDMASLSIRESSRPEGTLAAAAVRLSTFAGAKFSPKPGEASQRAAPDELTFYLGGRDTLAMSLYEQLLANSAGVGVRVGTAPADRLGTAAPREDEFDEYVIGPDAIERVGFEAREAMLPYDARSFHGYRLLHEYFAFPQRFMFVRVKGLRRAFERWTSGPMELFFFFDRGNSLLEDAGRRAGGLLANFQLFCTPAINLFPKEADHTFVTPHATEFVIHPDRTRTSDFEVHSVTSVTGYSTQGGHERVFRPFYRAHAQESGTEGEAYHFVHRLPRGWEARGVRGGRRASYSGCDVSLSLVDATSAPWNPDINRLAVSTLCTNRDLPMFFEPAAADKTDFTLDITAPSSVVKCVSGPSRPWGSAAEGETMWRLVSHLSANYVSLVEEGASAGGGSGLRDLLRLYSEWTDAEVRPDGAWREQVRKQVESIVELRRRPITHRLPRAGPLTFARGVELSVTFDEGGFEGSGAFLLGAVLEQFFARYVSINSFTQTVVSTTQRGVLKRWPITLGQRPVL